MKKAIPALAVLPLLPAIACADDVFDVLERLPIQRPDSTTQTLDSSLYAASVIMALKDGDGNNANFSNADTMQRMVLSSRGYSTVLEIKDYTAHSLFLNAIARF
jgi:hypothetical protein